jgi:hypothetical protein
MPRPRSGRPSNQSPRPLPNNQVFLPPSLTLRINLTAFIDTPHLRSTIPPHHQRCPPWPARREQSPAHGSRTSCPSRGPHRPPCRPAARHPTRTPRRRLTAPSRALVPRPRSPISRRTGVRVGRRAPASLATLWSALWARWLVWARRLLYKVGGSCGMSESSESNIFERRGVVEGVGEPLAVLRMV